MHIQHDPRWPTLTARVLRHELVRLDAVLLDNGVTDSLVRQQICRQFLHMKAAFFDTGWLADGERTLYPVLGFAESTPRGERSHDWRLLVPPPHSGSSFMALAEQTLHAAFGSEHEDLLMRSFSCIHSASCFLRQLTDLLGRLRLDDDDQRALLFREIEALSGEWDLLFNATVPLGVGTITSDVREVGPTRSTGEPPRGK